MEDYGIKVTREDINVVDESNKKGFNFLNTADSHKIIYADFTKSTIYDHNLGFVPFFLAFQVDSGGTPSVFTAISTPRATASRITNLPNPGYLIIFRERR